MRKLFAVVVLALSALMSPAQENKDRESYAASPSQIASQAFTYTHALPSDLGTIHYFNVLFDAAPTSVTMSVTPCTGSPTDATKVCRQPIAGIFTSMQDSVLPVYGTADYYVVSVTWNGQIGRASLGITGYTR